jgi:hypothetical protein
MRKKETEREGIKKETKEGKKERMYAKREIKRGK